MEKFWVFTCDGMLDSSLLSSSFSSSSSSCSSSFSTSNSSVLFLFLLHKIKKSFFKNLVISASFSSGVSVFSIFNFFKLNFEFFIKLYIYYNFYFLNDRISYSSISLILKYIHFLQNKS